MFAVLKQRLLLKRKWSQFSFFKNNN